MFRAFVPRVHRAFSRTVLHHRPRIIFHCICVLMHLCSSVDTYVHVYVQRASCLRVYTADKMIVVYASCSFDEIGFGSYPVQVRMLEV